jgi:hypothetical protein
VTRVKAVVLVVAFATIGVGLAGCTSNDNGGVIVPPPATTTTAAGFGGGSTPTVPSATSTSLGTLPSS